MIFCSLFKKRNKRPSANTQAAYASSLEFVDDNLADVKALLSFSGCNNMNKRLEDLAQMVRCRAVALCQKSQGNGRFLVVASSDKVVCKPGDAFNWPHMQPWASSDLSVVRSLPFDIPEATGLLSVPVKDERNAVVGVVIGVSSGAMTNVDSKIRLMHILAPLFEADIRCAKYKQEMRQQEQRIASLNQSLEIMTSDLNKERKATLECREFKSIFLTNLSQEIRTPMNAIIGFLDLLKKESEPDVRDKFIDLIRKNSQMLLGAIDNIIDISKLQSSYMLKPACPVQLNELLTKIKQQFADELKRQGKNVTIETSFALETPKDTIWNSEEIIVEVMERLLDNACRFTEQGKISISYSFNQKEIVFCVADTGSGIPDEAKDSLFKLFDDSVLEGGPTKGIGLAIAAKYLSLANGRIWLDDTYRPGSCFYFSIPTEKL